MRFFIFLSVITVAKFQLITPYQYEEYEYQYYSTDVQTNRDLIEMRGK